MSQRRRFCHFGGVLRWFHWMMSLDNPQCVRWRESCRDDDIFVSVNNHWFLFMKSHIYWYLWCYFLWSYCDKIVFSYFMCTLSQTLFLSTSLLLGSFRYVFNIIIVLTTCIVSICRFYVSFSFDIVYIYIFIYVFIYWKSGTSDLLVLMIFVLQCTDYR